MPLTIFMCGHGAWKPKDGFIQLPAYTSMSLVVEIAKVLYTTDMYDVCGGTFPRDYARLIENGTCPNMTWTADDPAKVKICDDRLAQNQKAKPAQVLFPNHLPNLLDGSKSLTLEKFFNDYWEKVSHNLNMQFGSTHFVWNCCSYADLKPSAMGAELGVNAAHGAQQYDHISYVTGIKLTGKISSL
ncbi:MAG: hypothetical protein K2Q23_06295 [Bryobacteraceae bacterium]|nr:hypothetical protein [Bryobacteraceae bacterium]